MSDSSGGGGGAAAPAAARSNLLGREASPYLLQHASNPVWWHAWDDAALARAVDEDKPIFLSVGYSSCHWCHVMAHESFEDEGIAALLNEHFVSIKVDREERPDVDDVYQKACQMATGQGGWPLSVFLTPDRKPFYAGTYFPPSDVGGRRGFGSVLRWLAQAWAEHRPDVSASAEKFAESLRRAEAPAPLGEGAARGAAFDRAAADEAAVNLLGMADEHNGGFGTAPKFPNSACVSLLFRYGRMSGLARFTRLALRTLDRMAAGGIFDHVGGGFHRYSTDSRWLVPHFEKMLYDNALIPVNYAEAYQVTGDAAYLDVMDRTLEYVLRELAAPGGGFYSAQDADAGGEEGLYYTWTRREALDVLRGGGGGCGALSAAEADAFCAYYDVTDGGNWEGRTILCNSAPLHAVAFRFGIGDDAAREALRAGRAKLLEHRSRTREAPGLDDNVIASWNALAASALAAGHRVNAGRGYLDAAAGCAERVAFGMRGPGGGVSRVARPGRDAIPGGLDDHAHCANALLDVFEARPEERYLARAAELGRIVCERFWDEESGGFFMTAGEEEEEGGGGGGGPAQRGLVVRPRSRHDMSVPSGGSAAVRALMRLRALTGEAEPGRVAARALAAQAREAAENPFAFGHLLSAAFSIVDDPPEVTIVNPAASDIAKRVLSMYLPGSPVVAVSSAGQLAALSRYPYFAGKPFGDRTEVYVCRAGACSAPMSSLDRVEAELAGASGQKPAAAGRGASGPDP